MKITDFLKQTPLTAAACGIGIAVMATSDAALALTAGVCVTVIMTAASLLTAICAKLTGKTGRMLIYFSVVAGLAAASAAGVSMVFPSMTERYLPVASVITFSSPAVIHMHNKYEKILENTAFTAASGVWYTILITLVGAVREMGTEECIFGKSITSRPSPFFASPACVFIILAIYAIVYNIVSSLNKTESIKEDDDDDK